MNLLSAHVALAGAIEAVESIVETMGLHIASADPDFRVRWQRDRSLLQVASKARTARLDKAWEAVTGQVAVPVPSLD